MTNLVTSETIAPGEIEVKPVAGDKRFYSVTTIISALAKQALIFWAANETAESAVLLAEKLPAMIEKMGREDAVKYLANSRNRPPEGGRTASELGTAVHDACEQYALMGVRPEVDEEVMPFLDRFDEWCQLWQPTYLAAEAVVYSDTFGYAGTLDAIAIIDGRTVVVDYKSSRKSYDARGKVTKPYPEAALQLSAYRYAEMLAVWRARRYETSGRRYYLLNEDEQALALPMPKVDGAVVLHITPEHANLHPVKANESIFERFLYVIEAFKWTDDISKAVIGDQIERKA